MERQVRVLLALHLLELAALAYVWWAYKDRITALVSRAESVSGKLEAAGL